MTYPSTGRFLPRALSAARLCAALGRTIRRPAWRLAVWAPLAVALMLPMAGCDDGKEAECRKAISNIRTIYGTADNQFGVSPEAMVRSCQGSSSPESVRCFIQARTIDDVKRCEGDTFKDMFGSEPGEQKPGEQPVEQKPGEQPVEKPGEQPVEQPGVQPGAQNPVEQPGAQPGAQNPVEQPGVQPGAQQGVQQPAEGAPAQP